MYPAHLCSVYGSHVHVTQTLGLPSVCRAGKALALAHLNQAPCPSTRYAAWGIPCMPRPAGAMAPRVVDGKGQWANETGDYKMLHLHAIICGLGIPSCLLAKLIAHQTQAYAGLCRQGTTGLSAGQQAKEDGICSAWLCPGPRGGARAGAPSVHHLEVLVGRLHPSPHMDGVLVISSDGDKQVPPPFLGVGVVCVAGEAARNDAARRRKMPQGHYREAPLLRVQAHRGRTGRLVLTSSVCDAQATCCVGVFGVLKVLAAYAILELNSIGYAATARSMHRCSFPVSSTERRATCQVKLSHRCHM